MVGLLKPYCYNLMRTTRYSRHMAMPCKESKRTGHKIQNKHQKMLRAVTRFPAYWQALCTPIFSRPADCSQKYDVNILSAVLLLPLTAEYRFFARSRVEKFDPAFWQAKQFPFHD